MSKEVLLNLIEEEVYRFAGRKQTFYNKGRLKGAAKVKLLVEKNWPDMDRLNEVFGILITKASGIATEEAQGFIKSLKVLVPVAHTIYANNYSFEFPTHKQRWQISELERKFNTEFKGISKLEATLFLEQFKD